MAVILKPEDVPFLDEILRNIPEQEVESMREAGRKSVARFVWISPSANPLGALPIEQAENWAFILEESDVVASLMLLLENRLKKTEEEGSWLGGALLEEVKEVDYTGRMSFKPKWSRSATKKK